tara:strand:+ start:160 stop:609 length:450 start_codon:yes stop_codon:yes gene_type:complete
VGIHDARVAEACLVNQKGRTHDLIKVVDVAVGSQADGDSCVEKFWYRGDSSTDLAVSQRHVTAAHPAVGHDPTLGFGEVHDLRGQKARSGNPESRIVFEGPMSVVSLAPLAFVDSLVAVSVDQYVQFCCANKGVPDEVIRAGEEGVNTD